MCNRVTITAAEIDAAEKVLHDTFDKHGMPDGYWRSLAESIVEEVAFARAPHPADLLARGNASDREIRAAVDRVGMRPFKLHEVVGALTDTDFERALGDGRR